MERALRESEEKYRALYTSMNEGVALHRIIYAESGQAKDYVITDVNPGYESILDMTREQVDSGYGQADFSLHYPGGRG